MKRTLTTIRCVPRYGYAYAQVRTIDIDLPDEWDEHQLHRALTTWFQMRGVPDAVYAVETDDRGLFAIINDEAYQADWGTPLL